MNSVRMMSCAVALLSCLSCISLNYPDEISIDGTLASDSPHVDDPANTSEPENALRWNDLTRLAREHQQRGEFGKARERLEQASMQIQSLPAGHARQLTVFGLRARLAMALANTEEIAEADEMADQLFAEAENAPELGGAALVALAVSVADRRQEVAINDGETQSQLPILRIALAAAQAGSASRVRVDLASRVASEAIRDDEIDLARLAIDQAVSDAYHLFATIRPEIAELRIQQARIALAQHDLVGAENAAISVNQIFEELDADASSRGRGEAVYSEILAAKGETEKALAIANGAVTRIGGEQPIANNAQRIILTALARVEQGAGNIDSARRHFNQALAIPPLDSAEDVDLVKRLMDEIQGLGAAE